MLCTCQQRPPLTCLCVYCFSGECRTSSAPSCLRRPTAWVSMWWERRRGSCRPWPPCSAGKRDKRLPRRIRWEPESSRLGPQVAGAYAEVMTLVAWEPMASHTPSWASLSRSEKWWNVWFRGLCLTTTWFKLIEAILKQLENDDLFEVMSWLLGPGTCLLFLHCFQSSDQHLVSALHTVHVLLMGVWVGWRGKNFLLLELVVELRMPRSESLEGRALWAQALTTLPDSADSGLCCCVEELQGDVGCRPYEAIQGRSEPWANAVQHHWPVCPESSERYTVLMTMQEICKKSGIPSLVLNL